MTYVSPRCFIYLHIVGLFFLKKKKSDKIQVQVGQQVVALKETTLNIPYETNDYIYGCVNISFVLGFGL